MAAIAGNRWAHAGVAAGLLAMVGGVGVCWVLAAPDGPSVTAGPAAVALGAAVLLVGLGALPSLDARASSYVVLVTGVIWLVAGVVTGWVRAADRVGVTPSQVRGEQFVQTLTTGAPEIVTSVAALLVIAWAVVDIFGDHSVPDSAVAVLGAIGVLVVSVTGHAGLSTLAPILVGVHALAAAWWCGSLAAMVLSLRGRSGWARSLPVFSQRALPVVGVLTLTGIVAALMETGIGELFTTGYGRILVAKLLGLALLVALGLRHRRRWVRPAVSHRVTEQRSVRMALAEVILMAVVLGLAVGLSTTAPG